MKHVEGGQMMGLFQCCVTLHNRGEKVLCKPMWCAVSTA